MLEEGLLCGVGCELGFGHVDFGLPLISPKVDAERAGDMVLKFRWLWVEDPWRS